ncbi:bifunctional acetate--CoA ligase family protein/GNAT family N-acetyltransferase [Methyloversatilis thermotolerans]|uniref:bifunctional acetate--CoA ligase family protein/GNAT family N-acetyltransferase n=1 Tax=Methyloversatilis thermotolerans TaxID=1346290 RepID=UPI00036BF9BC|nr:bifunctional acetate--CoA ligase family protein/GNAT family N-acetyltransferase [Methyloversatilis thermotolerans]
MQYEHYLKSMFEPQSVAVLGATERAGACGSVIMRNMIDSGFAGELHAINPKHDKVFGRPCVARLEDLRKRPDLVILCTPARTIPGLIEECGRAGIKAAIIVSGGFTEAGPAGAELLRRTRSAAKRGGVRVIGPNCLGLLRPSLGLNASHTRSSGKPGSIGLISQSGAVCAALLDWAQSNGVGFSTVVSLGGAMDLDFGEILDYMIADPKTESVFMFIEGVRDARRFMSAVRAAARVKPVFAIKVGRHATGARTFESHTGALVGSDDVFDAALRRAGVVRLYSLGQMFSAANALFTGFKPAGKRLAIVTNGSGPAMMATDRATDLGIPVAMLAPETLDVLNRALPPTWSRGNPVDLGGDADAARYHAALEAVLADPGVDGVLTLLSPLVSTQPTSIAETVIELAKTAGKPMMTCWMGCEQVREARALFEAAHIPSFRSPEPSVELFHHIASYYRNQQLLRQAPASLAQDLDPPSVESARLVIETALSERRTTLTEMESKALLAAFRIPIAQTVVARSATEAMVYAEEMGLPVAMKIDSPDISHKSDVGGVRLHVDNLRSVRDCWQELMSEVGRRRPEAKLRGVSIEPMVIKRNARELFVGVVNDEVFGPVISFGYGGTRIEVLGDRAVTLPPINVELARDAIQRTRAAAMLGEFRGMPPIDMDALERVLIRVSEMVCELPWIREMDINPLLVDEDGCVAVDARITLADVQPTATPYSHMAIHPYPARLEHVVTLPNGTRALIRPIRPEDADREARFVRELSPETRYLRFMSTIKELPPQLLARLTQIDYDREMALVAIADDDAEQLGVCRYVVNPDGESCEFAIVIADAWQRQGLARIMMNLLIETARERGLRVMEGVFLANNERMLRFVQSLGFHISRDPEDSSLVNGELLLRSA